MGTEPWYGRGAVVRPGGGASARTPRTSGCTTSSVGASPPREVVELPTEDRSSDLHDLVRRFVSARRDRSRVVLEGYHAVKHALRFGAEITEVVALAGIAAVDLPPELAAAGMAPRDVDGDVFDRLVPARPPLPLVALATRPYVAVGDALAGPGPSVLLEQPTHLGNLGAAIRVAAAAGAAGVVSTGRADPWGPGAVRGAAGLQFALPVVAADRLPDTGRPLVAFDPEGTPLGEVAVPPRPLLAFGTERRGISATLRREADLVVRIPMRPKVSSLNLATSVAVALYALPGALHSPVGSSGSRDP